MYTEDEYLMLSGIQHYRFCPRQCAFIHTDQMWTENFFTAHGRMLHEKVHSGSGESRGKLRIERSLRISSASLGLIGQTDAVEFYADGMVCPVEYKRGTTKADSTDRVQLCAQAICLEEMLGIRIEKGYLFYEKIKRREEVPLTDELRDETQQLADSFHELVESGRIPPAEYAKRCESCSFIDDCFPDTAGTSKSVSSYISRQLSRDLSEGEDE
jgi:CRISPR-associated exonuclease Cas4